MRGTCSQSISTRWLLLLLAAPTAAPAAAPVAASLSAAAVGAHHMILALRCAFPTGATGVITVCCTALLSLVLFLVGTFFLPCGVLLLCRLLLRHCSANLCCRGFA